MNILGIVLTVSSLIVPIFTFAYNDISLSEFVKFSGTGGGMHIGSTTSFVGDVNGDGYADFAIGNVSTGGGGSVYLVEGNSSLLTSISLDIYSQAILNTTFPEHNISQNIEHGDIDADGYEDILISYTGMYGSGEVSILYGSSNVSYLYDAAREYNDQSIKLSSELDYKGNVQALGDYAGGSLATGDFNGDSYDDFVVGARYNDGAGTDAGAVYIFYGKADQFTSGPLSGGIKISGDVAGDSIGSFLSSGDVNGDGYDDVFIGGNDTSILYGKTSKFVSASLSSVAQEVMTGSYTPSVIGDVNADGYDEFVIGVIGDDDAGTDAGAAYLFYGKSSKYDSIDLTSGIKLVGESAQDKAGLSSSVGDVNGDEYDDILIFASGDDDAGTDAGATYLFLGQSDHFVSTSLSTADFKFTAEAPGDQSIYTQVGSIAGDVNNDGYDDILIGSGMNDHCSGSSCDYQKDQGAAYIGYVFADFDGDGVVGVEGLVNGTDLNDYDYDNDGIETEDDCDDRNNIILGKQAYYFDADGDGLGSDTSLLSCSAILLGYVINSNDSDDTDSSSDINTDADGDGVLAIDDCDDSNAAVTETKNYYFDADGDGLGSDTQMALCFESNFAGYVENSNDTNDAVPNDGVEIDGDGVDNDDDGEIDEVNTKKENGTHPGYKDMDLRSTIGFSEAVTSIDGAKNGKIKIRYSDNSVYRYTIFHHFGGDRKALVKSFQGTGYITVLHPRGKKLKLINVYNGERLDTSKFAKRQKYDKNSLKYLDLRNDGNVEIVITSRRNTQAQVTVIRLRFKSETLKKKDFLVLSQSRVSPKRTKTNDENQLLLRDSQKNLLIKLKISKKYALQQA